MREFAPRVVGVRFRNAGKIFYFHAAGLRLEPGEYVIVETARGPEIARVVIAPEQVVVNELGREELKPILRLATDDDIRRMDELRRRAQEILPEARRIAEDAGFPARIDSAEFTLDGKRLTFSFTSEERLDYRDFLRRAGERFGVKVDMRQLGARDRAKLAGGYGICGRELCCSSWLASFPSISIRMAKEQELPLNPQKISGLCGRLLCCLSYEEEGYKEMRKTLPKLGQRCSTPTGEGRVVAVNILKRQVTLLVEGQRVEVPDRDLGTVVRWDPASKSAPPPPSLSREEAVALGMITAEEADLGAAAVGEDDGDGFAAWLPADLPVPVEGRGRLPGGGPRKEQRQKPPPAKEPDVAPAPRRATRSRRGRSTATETPTPSQGAPAEPRRAPGPRPEPAVELPKGRVFRRAERARPAEPDAPGDPPASPPPAAEPGPQGEAAKASSRRRRGRRGGRGRQGREGDGGGGDD